MAKRMKENNEGLTAAVNGIVNACKAVAENPKYEPIVQLAKLIAYS
jgi:hypothetical protein